MSYTLRGSSGFFIVLEGIDGSGKTTVAQMLKQDLTKLGFKVHYTYEPWDSHYVRVLKEHYVGIRDAYLDALTYACDRLVHLKLDVLTYLNEGYIVISDRYLYSSVAYQSSQNAPFDWVLTLNSIFPKPDLAILLDVDPEIGLTRRASMKSRFPEYEEASILRKVRENYLKLVELGLLTRIDANRPLDQVYRDVYGLVLTHLKGRSKTD